MRLNTIVNHKMCNAPVFDVSKTTLDGIMNLRIIFLKPGCLNHPQLRSKDFEAELRTRPLCDVHVTKVC